MNQTRARKPLRQSLISVVLPLYNEAAVLERLLSAVQLAFDPLGCQYEIVFVNDGSHDESGEILDRFAARDSRVRVVHLSRNFGHQAAVQAGLMHARGDAVVLMDSDLQDDPAAIPHFLKKWQEGYDVVYAVRYGRKEGPVKKAAFHWFYRVLNLISQTPIPNDAGNFGLIDRAVAQCITQLRDRDRYYPGLRRWVGFRQIGIPVERHARHDEKPRVSTYQLWKLAKAAIFSFSAVPLAMFYGIAVLSLLVCGASVAFTLYHKLWTGLAIPGWASLTITASFFGALNALGIGILGEYVIRIYDQVRARPLFVVARRTNFPKPADGRAERLLNWVADQWDDQPSATDKLDSIEAAVGLVEGT